MARPFNPEEENTEESSSEIELDDTNSVLVEPEPEPSEEDEDDDEEPAPVENAKARKRKRAGNYNELKETTARLEQALQQEREARARMEGLLQANLQQPRQQHQGPHPLEQAVEDALREQDEFYQAYHANLGKMTEAQKEQASRRARELETKKMSAVVRLENAKAGIQPQQSPQAQQQQAFQMQVDSRYPDLAGSSEQVRRWGWARVQQLQLENRHTNIWDLMDEAAEETRAKFGLPSTKSAPKPTATTKAKFTGTSKGPSGGKTAENKPLRITKKQAEMAEKAHPNLPPGKAHQKWWNEVGKKYA